MNKNKKRVCRTFNRRQWETRGKPVNGLEIITAPFANVAAFATIN